MFNGIIDFLNNFINQYSYFALFVIMAVENMGVPFPTEVGFLASATLIAQGKLSFFWTFMSITWGSVFGAYLAYILGYYATEAVQQRLNKTGGFSKIQEKIEKWYLKYGSITIFVTRIMGHIRPWSSFVAGIGRFNRLYFAIWTIIGSAVWAIITMLINQYFIVAISKLNPDKQYQYINIVIIACLISCFLILFGLKRSKKIKKEDTPPEKNKN